jgi:hypothetical protein
MHPIVTITLIFLGLGAAYWVVNNPGLAKSIGLGALASVISNYGNLIIKALFVAAIAYALWVAYEMAKAASLRNKSRKGIEKL